jgi:hypothetical protein
VAPPETLVEDVEELYSVPTHLGASDTIGIIPTRVFYLGLAMAIFGAILVLAGYLFWDEYVWLLVLVPIPFLAPFAVWWLTPPPEHGFAQALVWPFRRKTLHSQHIASTRDLRIEGSKVFYGKGEECVSVLGVASVNLTLMSAAGKRRHRRQYSSFLDGIGQAHPIQIVVRATALQPSEALGRMRLNRNPMARRVADWLSHHHEVKEAVDRRRFLVIPAPDPETLSERVEMIQRNLDQANIGQELLSDPDELKELLDHWWTWRPHPDRIGAERVEEHADCLQLDGEWARVYALGTMPTGILTNWLERIIDGDLAVDVSWTLEQQDLWFAKTKLDMRFSQVASSTLNANRRVALGQIEALRLSFEKANRPWDGQMLLVVRGGDKRAMERRSKRLAQKCRDLGIKLNLLRWEQAVGFAAAQPLCLPRIARRTMFLESGTIARTTLLVSSTLQVHGGVPMGLTGSVPAYLTTRGGQRAPHMGWYGGTGSGKGFAVRCFLSRRQFSERLRIFVWDADESHEYDGRFMDYLGGDRLVVESLDQLNGFQIDPLYQAFAFCVHDLPYDQRSQAFAKVKAIVQAHQLEFPAPTAFVVDEVTTILEDPDQAGATALADAAQRWRKTGLELHAITQRTSDYWGFLLGRKIAGGLPTKWYGAQEDTEINEMGDRLGLSPEEQARLSGAGIGQALVVTLGQRAWVDFYDHGSPDEYGMAHTDPPESQHILRKVYAA